MGRYSEFIVTHLFYFGVPLIVEIRPKPKSGSDHSVGRYISCTSGTDMDANNPMNAMSKVRQLHDSNLSIMSPDFDCGWRPTRRVKCILYA